MRRRRGKPLLDTGRLRSSIIKQLRPASVVVGSSVQYAVYQQFGTKSKRALEIAIISRSLKALAKELNVSVLALPQLNRAIETRVNKEPLLSDLRESGALEQDADIVLFLHEKRID